MCHALVLLRPLLLTLLTASVVLVYGVDGEGDQEYTVFGEPMHTIGYKSYRNIFIALVIMLTVVLVRVAACRKQRLVRTDFFLLLFLPLLGLFAIELLEARVSLAILRLYAPMAEVNIHLYIAEVQDSSIGFSVCSTLCYVMLIIGAVSAYLRRAIAVPEQGLGSRVGS